MSVLWSRSRCIAGAHKFSDFKAVSKKQVGFSLFLFVCHLPTSEGGDIGLDLLEMLLLLLQGLQRLVQLVVGLVKLDLEAVDFLAIVTDVAVSLE